MNIRTIHIPTDPIEVARLIDIPSGQVAEKLHELVSGYFQCVELNDGVHLWLNEEGKLNGMPWNPRAQMIWNLRFGIFTDHLVGPAVLTGGTDPRGVTLGLSDEQIAGVDHMLSDFSPVARVRIENTYEDGHESATEVWIALPDSLTDPESIEEWWMDDVYAHTGNGHGATNPKLGSYHEATVISGPAELVGQTFDW